VARHRLEDTLLTVVELQEDPSARVRTAASRALMRISVSALRTFDVALRNVIVPGYVSARVTGVDSA
jgi:hypothetical protein